MSNLSKDSVNWVTIDENHHGQRVDNFLQRLLKGVPISHIYRILRSGEVRVNSGRVTADHRLNEGDKIRIPPIRLAKSTKPLPNKTARKAHLRNEVLYEDDSLVVINKPSGTAVHGGSGISMGVIEQLRAEYDQPKFLELVHRLDRETSGVLILAKKRQALIGLHDQIRNGQVRKYYLVMVKGRWRNSKQTVQLPLHKYINAAGERRVIISEEGQEAHTVFSLVKNWEDYSLLEADLKTGRTHQIRVHLAHLGFPILGDDKYGDFALNKDLAKINLKRMFLHAYKIIFTHPLTDKIIKLEAKLPQDLQQFIDNLDAKDSN
jgi:23S rRNA pseudouridine955/2504/2580 synthase